jgi:hypothetical protein
MENFERKQQNPTRDEVMMDTIDHLDAIAVEKAEIVKILQKAVEESVRLNGKPAMQSVLLKEVIAVEIEKNTETLEPLALVEKAVKVASEEIHKLPVSAVDRSEIIRDFKAIVKESFQVKTANGNVVNLFDSQKEL